MTDLDTILTSIPSPRQRELVGRIASVLAEDERIVAAWLSGSLARGNADVYSDVDVRAIVADTSYPEVLAGLDEIVDRIGRTVLRRLGRTGDDAILTAVAPDWARFDIVLQPRSTFDRSEYPAVTFLFDRAGLRSRIKLVAEGTAAPVNRLAFLAEEFLRVLGLLPVVVGRGEWLVGMDGVTLLRRHLVDLFLIENEVADRGGVLRLNPYLTADQRALLEGFPPLAPDRETVLAGHLACARAFLARARALLARHGVPHPEALERATSDYLRASLGIEILEACS